MCSGAGVDRKTEVGRGAYLLQGRECSHRRWKWRIINLHKTYQWCLTLAVNIYPTPRTVFINGTISTDCFIFLRSQLTRPSTPLSSPVQLKQWSWSSKKSRERTRLGDSTNAFSKSNSAVVSSIPLLLTLFGSPGQWWDHSHLGDLNR